MTESFRPSDHEPRAFARLFMSVVVPRPVGWTSTVNGEGLPNLAPFSYFNGVENAPPMVMRAIGRRQGRPKDTLRNIQQTGDTRAYRSLRPRRAPRAARGCRPGLLPSRCRRAHGHWWDIARQYGPFDLAFLPINGVRYSGGRFTGSNIPATLTPEQAATAAHILGARQVCPIHYSRDNDPEHYRETLDAEQRFLAAVAERGGAVRLLAPGEILPIAAAGSDRRGQSR